MFSCFYESELEKCTVSREEEFTEGTLYHMHACILRVYVTMLSDWVRAAFSLSKTETQPDVLLIIC